MKIEPILLTCQNPNCEFFMTELGNILRRNCHNSAGNQRYYCFHCGKYFVETRHTPLSHSRLDRSVVEFLAKSCAEGVSIRALSRMTGFSRTPISRYYRIFGEHARLLNESHPVNIPPGECEMDEIWSYIGKKKRI